MAKSHEEKWLQTKHDCEQRHVQWTSQQQEWLAAWQHEQSVRLDETLQSVVSNELSAINKTWLTAARDELLQVQHSQQLRLCDEQDAARHQMKEELEHQLLAWKESVSSDWVELQEQVNAGKRKLEVVDQLQNDHAMLQGVADEFKNDLATSLDALEQRWQIYSGAKMEELHVQISDEVQQLLVLDTAKRSTDRKLKQQIQVFREKLVELDQMVKLVGKQLIQNTSQLQLLRREQHTQRQLQMVEELAVYGQENLLISASEDLEEGHQQNDHGSVQPNSSRNHHTAAAAKEEEETEEGVMLELRSQHQHLKHAIQDKLRHYQEVLQQE